MGQLMERAPVSRPCYKRIRPLKIPFRRHGGCAGDPFALWMGKVGTLDPNLRRISPIWRQTVQIRRGDRRCMWEDSNTITHEH